MCLLQQSLPVCIKRTGRLGLVFPVQETFFAVDFLYAGDILSYLENTAVFTLMVPNCKVLDKQVFITEVYPESGFVFFALAELVNYFVNNVHAIWWVAILHFTSQYSLCTRESPLRRIGEELYLVIFIHVGNVKR